MNWNLRPATNQDCAAVRQLVFGVLAEYGLMPDPDGTDADLKDIQNSYQVAGGCFDVLVDEAGRIVGSVGLSPVAPGVCELRKMYLSRSVRGKGQGRRLLDHALAQAAKLGFTRVELETASVLKEAVNLYERHGFRRCAPRHLAARCDSAYYLDLIPAARSDGNDGSNEVEPMNWKLRLATIEDVPALEELIPLSVRVLQAPYYSTEQMEAARGAVFGVDRQLITDGTYFVAEAENRIVGCGGWSKRKSLFGSDAARAAEDNLLDPATDSARVRAFFIHPDWARCGLGKAILAASESAIIGAGFSRIELVATLAGEPLYLACGYSEVERYEVPMKDGLNLPVVRMSKVELKH